MIATSSDHAKLEKARALGASDGIHYGETPEWGKVARELAGGEGVDLVVEVGGAGTLAQSLRAVRPGGTIGLIGILSGAAQDLDVRPILMRNVRVQGILVGHRASFEAMNRAFALHELRPAVDTVFGFDEVPAAFEHLRSGKHFGKVCIEVG